MGIVSEHLVGLIAKQVEERSLVVWYDAGADYRAVAERLDLLQAAGDHIGPSLGTGVVVVHPATV